MADIKISTTCFCNVRKLKPWQIPVSTACYDPKWFHDFHAPSYKFLDKNGVVNGLRAEFLHPGESCHGLCHGKPCSNRPEACSFLKAYRAQIRKLPLRNVLKRFQKLADIIGCKPGPDGKVEIVLLVHEAASNPCSERAALQELFGCQETDFTQDQAAKAKKLPEKA